MDRRKFLKGAIALGGAAAIPAIVYSEPNYLTFAKRWYPSREWLIEHSSFMAKHRFGTSIAELPWVQGEQARINKNKQE